MLIRSKVKEFQNYYLDDYDVPEKATTNPFEKIVANVTEREVSEEELEFNSDYIYDYDTDSSNDESTISNYLFYIKILS